LDENKIKAGLKLVEEILRNSDEMIRFSIKNNPETDAIYLMPSHLSNGEEILQ
jgi:hypothetical protein